MCHTRRQRKRKYAASAVVVRIATTMPRRSRTEIKRRQRETFLQ